MPLDELEDQNICIPREAFSKFERLTMLRSRGEDSTVLRWLARKLFFGLAPCPLAPLDASDKAKERCFSRRGGYV